MEFLNELDRDKGHVKHTHIPHTSSSYCYVVCKSEQTFTNYTVNRIIQWGCNYVYVTNKYSIYAVNHIFYLMNIIFIASLMVPTDVYR